MLIRLHINSFFYLFLAILTYGTALALLNSEFAYQYSYLLPAITIDLTVTTTVFLLFFYLKQKISPLLTGITFVLLIAIASFVIPANKQDTLQILITYAVPLIELSIVGLVIHKIHKAGQLYKNQNKGNFSERLRQVVNGMVKNKAAAHLIVSEINMFYYLFYRWKKSDGYSIHQKSGILAILTTVALLTVAETIVIHIILIKYSPFFAWIMFFLSLYTFLQLISLAKSIFLDPAVIDNNGLQLQYGWLKSVSISFDDISEIVENTKDLPEKDRSFTFMGLFRNMENHGVFIKLKKEVTIRTYLGSTSSDKVFIPIDESKPFIEELYKKLSVDS